MATLPQDLKVNILTVDLGTTNIIFRVNGKEMWRQPNCIAYDSTTKALYIGQEAKNMKEKLPPNIRYSEPMGDGVISDIDTLEIYVEEILKITEAESVMRRVDEPGEVKRGETWPKSIVLVAIPSKVDEVNTNTLVRLFKGENIESKPQWGRDTVERVMAAEKVVVVPEIKLACQGSGRTPWSNVGAFVLDIGGGTSDCSILANGAVVVQNSVAHAGVALDLAVKRLCKEMFFLDISSSEAEKVKIQAGLKLETEKPSTQKITIHGRETRKEIPVVLEVDRDIIATKMTEAFEPILKLVLEIRRKAPASFSEMITTEGLMLTGGGSLIKNLVPHLEKELGIPVQVASDARECVIRGTEIYEQHKERLYLDGVIKPS